MALPDLEPAVTAWSPLRHGMFRLLWLAGLTANVCMWMNELASAWLMSTLSSDPMLVALVRTASTLPAFVLALPSGALADLIDRRKWFMATQLWISVVALLLAAVVWGGMASPAVLLVLVLAFGGGLAMRWPVHAAIVPDLVPARELSQAVALNGLAANASRTIGPVIAGALMAWLGIPWVFALNAVLSLASALVIARWHPTPKAQALPMERFVGAMRSGLTYAAQSPGFRGVLWHSFAFALQTTALLALLPLVAKRLQGAEATYTMLMASMSVGAVAVAAWLPRWRSRMQPRVIVRWGAVIYSISTLVVAWSPDLLWVIVAVLPAGAAWMAVSNVLASSAQFALQDWVRARGMSLYLMSVMGGSAAGAALWGAVARHVDVPWSLTLSCLLGLMLVGAMRGIRFDDLQKDELKSMPITDGFARDKTDQDRGPVVVTIEYLIEPENQAAFAEVMRQSRRSRLRSGARRWGLLRDAEDPSRHVEYFVDENWVEQARRHERQTEGDVRLRERRLALHRGSSPPKVVRYESPTGYL